MTNARFDWLNNAESVLKLQKRPIYKQNYTTQ